MKSVFHDIKAMLNLQDSAKIQHQCFYVATVGIMIADHQRKLEEEVRRRGRPLLATACYVEPMHNVCSTSVSQYAPLHSTDVYIVSRGHAMASSVMLSNIQF